MLCRVTIPKRPQPERMVPKLFRPLDYRSLPVVLHLLDPPKNLNGASRRWTLFGVYGPRDEVVELSDGGAVKVSGQIGFGAVIVEAHLCHAVRVIGQAEAASEVQDELASAVPDETYSHDLPARVARAPSLSERRRVYLKQAAIANDLLHVARQFLPHPPHLVRLQV